MQTKVQKKHISINGFPPKDLIKLLCVELARAPKALLETKQVALLQERVRQDDKPNYTKDWAAFSYLFFAANFVKVFSAVRHVITPQDVPKKYRVLDLGCGAGASTAGILSALQPWLNKNNCSIDLIGIENNKEQVSLYKKVFRPWVDQFPSVNNSIRLQDALEFLENDTRKWDLIVVSYLFAELSAPQKNRLRVLLETKQKKNGTVILIVDTSPDTNKSVAEYFPNQRLLLKYPGKTLDLTVLSSLNVGILPKYATFHSTRENKDAIPQLLRDYFLSWETHDTNLLESIFCKNAVYEINGERWLKGFSAIKNYWQKNEIEQQDVRWRINKFSHSETEIRAEWSADFFRRDKSAHYHLDGTMQLGLLNNRISRLTEHYKKQVRVV